MHPDTARRGRITGLARRVALATGILLTLTLVGSLAVLAPVGPSVSETRPPAEAYPVTTTVPVRSPRTTSPAPASTGLPGVLPTTPGASDDLPGPASNEVLSATDPALRVAAERFLTDPSVVGHTVGISAWVEGHGEVLAAGGDRALQPASVQKLATAFAVMERLDPERRLRTVVAATTAVGPDQVLRGDLLLIGGGDPTLGRQGPHSLDDLARQVAAAGVVEVSGRLVVDASRWSTALGAPGWLDWHQPRHIGWMSALIADGNRWQAGADAADPARANGRWFAEALARRGVRIAGGMVVVGSPSGPGESTLTELAAAESIEIRELVATMLLTSDNGTAEAFLRELGRLGGGPGTPEGGAAVVTEVLDDLLGRPAGGHVADGSGLSRADLRSAREWQSLVTAARSRPWWPTIEQNLPLAGTTGTLTNRFGATPAAGNVRAKTGTTVEARSLAGVFTTPSGRVGVFAVVVNGSAADGPIGAEHAIDRLVVDLVGSS